MKIIESHKVKIATQSFGTEADATVLLVMGATASMLGWPDGLCEALAANGLRVWINGAVHVAYANWGFFSDVVFIVGCIYNNSISCLLHFEF